MIMKLTDVAVWGSRPFFIQALNSAILFLRNVVKRSTFRCSRTTIWYSTALYWVSFTIEALNIFDRRRLEWGTKLF